MEVRNIEEYAKFIPNASTTKIVIIHETNVVKRGKKKDNGMGMVNEKGEIVQSPQCSNNSNSSSTTTPSSPSKLPQSANIQTDKRGKQLLQIPPGRGPPNRWQGQYQGKNKQWQGPTTGWRQAREGSDLDGDWDYLDNNDNNYEN